MNTHGPQGPEAPTLGPQILEPLDIIHLLQRLGLLSRQRLLIVILSRSTYSIQEYPSTARIPEEVEYSENENDEGGRTKG